VAPPPSPPDPGIAGELKGERGQKAEANYSNQPPEKPTVVHHELLLNLCVLTVKLEAN